MTSYLRTMAAKLRELFGDRRADLEFDDKIQTHLRMLTERYVRQGMGEELARVHSGALSPRALRMSRSSVPCRRSAFGWVKRRLQIRDAYWSHLDILGVE